MEGYYFKNSRWMKFWFLKNGGSIFAMLLRFQQQGLEWYRDLDELAAESGV